MTVPLIILAVFALGLGVLVKGSLLAKLPNLPGRHGKRFTRIIPQPGSHDLNQ